MRVLDTIGYCLRAAFLSSAIASPDKRAQESIEKLNEVLDQRRDVLEQSVKRVARDL